jgi:hypothetical protein
MKWLVLVSTLLALLFLGVLVWWKKQSPYNQYMKADEAILYVSSTAEYQDLPESFRLKVANWIETLKNAAGIHEQ